MLARSGFRFALACAMLAASGGRSIGQPAPPPRPRELDAPARVESPPGEQDEHPIKRLDQKALREQMKICASQWTSMKQKGETAGLLWSDFSRGCLKRK